MKLRILKPLTKLISSKSNLYKAIPYIICKNFFSQYVIIVKTIASKIVKAPNRNEIKAINVEINRKNKKWLLGLSCSPH